MGDYSDQLHSLNSMRDYLIDRLQANRGLPLDTTAKRVLGYLTAKLIESSGAVLVLMGNDFVMDACIVARSMFNAGIDAMYIGEADRDSRAEQFLKWEKVQRRRILAGSKQAIEKILKQPLVLIEDDESGEIVNLDDAIDNLNNQLGGATGQRDWANSSILARCEQLGLGLLYETIYRTLSGVEHSCFSESTHYLANSVEALPAPPDVTGRVGLISAAWSLRWAAIEFFKVYQPSEVPAMKDFFKGLDDMADASL